MTMPRGRHRVDARRRVLRGTMAALCAGTLAHLFAQPKLERSAVSIAVAGKGTLYHLPLMLAEQLGYFKSEGLEVDVSDYPSTARAFQAVGSGAADLVGAPYEQTIYQHLKGQPYQAFAAEGRAPQMAFGVAVRALPNYQSPQDLKGRRIGVTAPGALTNIMARLVLERAGLAAGAVSYIAVGNSTGAVSALRSGQIDAICNVDPVITTLEQRGDVKVIADARSTRGTLEIFGGPLPAGCLMASAEFMQKYPGVVQGLTSAVVHALKWLQTAGPGDIIRTVPEAYLLGDRALYLAAFTNMREGISPDGLVPDEGARTALRAMSGFDSSLKAEKIDLARTYTNEFARRAKARYKA